MDVSQCHPGSQAKDHSVTISLLPAFLPVVPLSSGLVSLLRNRDEEEFGPPVV